MTELEAGLEAVLFAAGDAVPVDRLAAALETSRGALMEAAASLENLYDFENRGIMLLRLEDKLQLCSRPLYADAARRVTESRRPPSLSPAALEVLTIVAYRQPVTRAFIDQLRGVDSGGTVAGLVEKGLIEEAGRMDVPGRRSCTARPRHFCGRLRSAAWMSCPPCPRSGKTSRWSWIWTGCSRPSSRRLRLCRTADGRKRSEAHMAVILWILAVLLGILVFLLLLGLVLLWVRAGVEAVGATGAVSVEARYGFIRIPVWPRPKHVKRARAGKSRGSAAEAQETAQKPEIPVFPQPGGAGYRRADHARDGAAGRDGGYAAHQPPARARADRHG